MYCDTERSDFCVVLVLRSARHSSFDTAHGWQCEAASMFRPVHLLILLKATFVKRLDHYFGGGLLCCWQRAVIPGASYEYIGVRLFTTRTQTAIGYHYANQPTKSVDQVRNLVFSNFDISEHFPLKCGACLRFCSLAPAGLPGNDDQGAMGYCSRIPIFLGYTQVHIIYTYLRQQNHLDNEIVPSTSQLLVVSPFTPKYTVHNSFLNVSTTVTVKNFNAKSVQK